MARSASKRISGVKPKSRKAQLKFIKRMNENQRLLNKIKSELN